MNLGNVNRKNLHFAEAELYYLEVMRELELTKGQNNSEFSALLHNLSNLYIDIGLYDKALYTDSCNHKIITNYIGEKSAQAAANFFNFGRNFQQIYELEQAIINYEKSRIITHQIFGNQHPYYLIILTNLGLIYYELNDFLKAKQYYDEAIVISTSQLGENSIKSCDILIRLSLINLKLKDINSAKLYLNRVKNIFKIKY
jgi:tetratricopeptide (TPR) repeat protein